MPTGREFANAIRALSMDAVQKANSGHPGAPMGMADIAELLWRDVLKFNPGNPLWWDRDRFVLSNGHASMLLYSVLHLTGYPLPMDELNGNGISIDGKVKGWFTDDTARRFEAYGSHVLPQVDGHDSDSIAAALAAARAVTDRPSLICARTVIGWGAPNKQGSASMHGEPMGADEIAAARVRLGWTAPPFEIPADIRAGWDMREKGARIEREWRTKFEAYKAEFPALAAELERRMGGDLPSGFDGLAQASIDRAQSEGKTLATRQSSQAALNSFGPTLPELLGGSADLTPSNGTMRKDSLTLTPESPAGNYVHFGARSPPGRGDRARCLRAD
jgi:transketolase